MNKVINSNIYAKVFDTIFVFKKLVVMLLLSLCCAVVSCSKDDTDTSGNSSTDDDDDTSAPSITYWRLDTATAGNMTISISSGAYVMKSTTGDPQILTEKLTAVNDADSVVLTFEYKSSHEASFEGFLSPVSPATMVAMGTLEATTEWKTFSCNLKYEIEENGWGDRGDFLRLDFARESGVEISLRKMYMRKMNDEEQSAYDKDAAEKDNVAAVIASLDSYISESYPSKIDNVTLDTSANKVTISGSVASTGDYSICEITPYEDVTTEKDFEYAQEVENGSFSVELDRYVERDGFTYDRALSKWVVVKSEAGVKSIDSHARYTDDVTPEADGSVMELQSKKGLGGVAAAYLNVYPNDMRELGVHSVTYNILLQTVMNLNKSAKFSEAYEYGGKTYYIDPSFIKTTDNALKKLNNDGISVAGILLVSVSGSDDIYDLMLHPRYTSGSYSMPNMTTAESVNCYAAVLNYLASKFSRSTSNGKIDHWIMHNEVSAGSIWTNMGSAASTPMSYYVDTYGKSMRMAYNIVRQYNPESEIFMSLTNHWTDKYDYSSRDMMDKMVEYSNAEGDYKWAIGYHSYPEDLKEHKLWIDDMATFTKDTERVTFKNLEVLSEWALQRDHFYKGTTKRSVWLSENGTNSNTYSDADLYDQAAGCAYALKKLNGVEGIDAIQWHRWIDMAGEGDLLLGLRKLEDDVNKCEKKPAYYVFSAVDTEDESSVIDKYFDYIGITSWDEIFHDVE